MNLQSLKLSFIRYDSVIGTCSELDEDSHRIIEPHKLFRNNFDLRGSQLKHGHVWKHFSSQRKMQEDKGVFDVILYLAANLFKASNAVLHLMLGLRVLVKNSFNHLVDYGIRKKLSNVLTANRIAYLCRLTQSAIFEPNTVTEADKLRRKEQALENFQNYLRPFVQFLFGREKFEVGTQFIFDCLQDPKINKQLAYVLIDLVAVELFPELKAPHPPHQAPVAIKKS